MADGDAIDILTSSSDEIIARLQDECSEYEVMEYPDNPGDYVLNHPKGAMLLVFGQFKLRPPETAIGKEQPSTIDFQLSIMNRSLLKNKENPGAYTMISKAFKALYGFTMSNHQSLYCQDIKLIGISKNRYHYAMMWRLPVWIT